jgi:hypothetical protein
MGDWVQREGIVMKLKAILLLLLLPALMLLVACTGGPSEADINATVEAKVEQA